MDPQWFMGFSHELGNNFHKYWLLKIRIHSPLTYVSSHLETSDGWHRIFLGSKLKAGRCHGCVAKNIKSAWIE